MWACIWLRTSQLYDYECAVKTTNATLSLDKMKLPNVWTPPNFSDVLIFLDLMVFRESSVPTFFSNLLFFPGKHEIPNGCIPSVVTAEKFRAYRGGRSCTDRCEFMMGPGLWSKKTLCHRIARRRNAIFLILSLWSYIYIYPDIRNHIRPSFTFKNPHPTW